MPALLNVVLTGVHLQCLLLLLLLLLVAALLWLLLASVVVVKLKRFEIISTSFLLLDRSERGLSVLPFSQDNKRIRIASGKNSLFVVRR